MSDNFDHWTDGIAELAFNDCRERDQENYYKEIDEKRKRYTDNKLSDIGTTIRCANCSKRILKKSYLTQFCSNKGKGNCKDNYWNCATTKRLFKSQVMNR